MKKIFILTGEPSGDKLASKVIRELKKDKSDIKDKTWNGLYKPLFHTNDYYTALYLSHVGRKNPDYILDLFSKNDYNSSNTINFKFLKNIILEII